MAITGVLARLTSIENKINREVEKEIGKCAYTLIETKAKQKLTTDRHVVTGRLRASIRTALENSSLIKRATISTNLPYAKKIEFRYDSYLGFAFETSREQIDSKLRFVMTNAIS